MSAPRLAGIPLLWQRRNIEAARRRS